MHQLSWLKIAMALYQIRPSICTMQQGKKNLGQEQKMRFPYIIFWPVSDYTCPINFSLELNFYYFLPGKNPSLLDLLEIPTSVQSNLKISGDTTCWKWQQSLLNCFMDVTPEHIALWCYHIIPLEYWRPNPPWSKTLGGNGRHEGGNGGVSLSGSLVIVSILSKDFSLHKRNNLDMQMCIPN